VKRLFAWVAGAAGGLAAYRAVKTRPRTHEPAVDDRAAELKARLEAARAAEDDRADVEPGELGVDEALDPQARRAQVHEQGRAALDEMRSDN
jgi:alkylation response protein AidB-like acyl-CoA dehydrogenase